ncbi:hypothetical protein GQF42_43315 [Streptomyces broussonetiae]|uniref:Uncharacterized protein n=1 Tax=Streptomyces broussonetiae TaxID=2686304 RepID=A0A6I6NCL6_9ACTN|nr:hypothetical protein GQF42_43315 [Streptomyces broussonetiae]
MKRAKGGSGSNAQQPEQRHSDKDVGGGHAHGTDKGNKGGGEGGGVPPDQRPDHP